MLEKLDEFYKGMKQYTTTGVFALMVAALAPWGVDLGAYVEDIDRIYEALFALYGAAMILLRRAMADKRRLTE